MKALLHIYDFFTAHKTALWISFAVLMVPLLFLALSLRYDEDIMDFLPVTEEDRVVLDALQNQQEASRIVLIVEGEDEDLRLDALDEINDKFSVFSYHLSTFDLSNFQFSIFNFPLSISDSLFTPEAVHKALLRDKSILSTPGTSFLTPIIQADPLGLVDLKTIDQRQALSRNKSFAFIESPYGSTETKHNAALIDSLHAVTDEVAEAFPDLNIRWIGAPVIAVGNARRIKTDTILCISLSLVFIIALLLYAFPRRRDLALILLSVTFGWIFGMAILRLVTPTVSAVVLGIGSVLIGIAVNYPLHLLVHQRYTTSVRQTLNEVLSPLVVGNITTVGAFLALVPLQATAMRHLGIFAAAMLIGTILFCVFVLPHLMSAEPTPVRDIKMVNGKWSNGKWIVLALTLVAGVYLMVNGKWSNGTWFDPNPSHINYMTAQQRADMEAFESFFSNDQRQTTNDQWSVYWQTHNPQTLISLIQTEAVAVGFRPDAFQPFYDQLLTANFQRPTTNDQRPMVNIISRLSDSFDYLGLVCSIIVFAFLWLSFRSIWLALIAFVPMALSWVWILALMQLFGLQFNIVNIILATFIFGQGDDYTIFIVEGLLYEHRTGKPMLPQYRQSIILSALIMLIGIGILVFAQHPAMHSLGTVTLIGMSVVLIMAVSVPPLLFRLFSK
ncbi:MAG: MMPL family transporter [Paludibacteraceae bacterium]|nr:MMPL family transporter [Paludibacteraceae bacterium]